MPMPFARWKRRRHRMPSMRHNCTFSKFCSREESDQDLRQEINSKHRTFITPITWSESTWLMGDFNVKILKHIPSPSTGVGGVTLIILRRIDYFSDFLHGYDGI